VRILLVHNRYRAPGGEERHVELLEEGLRAAGCDVTRLQVSSPEEATVSERLRIGLALAYRPAGARLMREALAREKPSIVHFHNLFPLLTPAAVREARVYGARTILTIHNYRFACPAGTLLRNGRIHEDCIDGSSLLCGLRNSRGAWSESLAYGIALEVQRRLRMLHRWVDAYVTPSKFIATMLARAGYPAERIHTIYHSTPIEPEPSSAGDFAFYAGRLSSEKGVSTLLEAAARAPRVPLRIAGDGPLTDLVRQEANSHLTYLGHVGQNAIARLRREALVTVAPSECYEGQPLGVLESMAAGTPVIASRLGGLAEIVEDGETGVLVPAGDAGAFADAMEALWKDRPRAAALGRRAWLYAREHFTPETQTRRLIALYESVTSERVSTHDR
jgi:glycosyltransferase involved in cell wall biosynthesis